MNYKIRALANESEVAVTEFLECRETHSDCFIELVLRCIMPTSISQLWVEFELPNQVDSVRSSDYRWISPNSPDAWINYHSTKALKLIDGTYCSGLYQQGVWTWDQDSSVLNWILIHPDLTPTFFYDAKDERNWVNTFQIDLGFEIPIGIYRGAGPIPEVARTPIGFVPTVCFTDHCDFDTPILLEKQRLLFKKFGIKTTKGFFKYTYSHRGDYAAYDQPEMHGEFKRWEKDGHELAFHALSRSFRKESWQEFEQLAGPAKLNDITTYIDHGFLPYNYTQQNQSNLLAWYRHMYSKGVRLIWNYVDVIEGSMRSNNQLVPTDFTSLALVEEGALSKTHGVQFSQKRNIRARIAYSGGESLENSFKKFRASIVFLKKGGIVPLFKALVDVAKELIDPAIWKKILIPSTVPFRLARFSPVFFSGINQQGTDLLVFQTISVKDFSTILSAPSLDKLERESGLIIAHTYFGYLGKNHPGRLFLDDKGTVNPKSAEGFEELGIRIKQGRIWNPTAKELASFHRGIMNTRFIVKDGKLIPKNNPGAVRWIS